MSVKIIDTLKPKNNGSFPIVEAVDVAVTSELRLPEALETKADASALAETNAAVETKANSSDVATATANLQGQINQIEISATAEAVVAPEVAAARVSENGTEYETLKERLDTQDSSIRSDLFEFEKQVFNEKTTESLSLYHEDWVLNNTGTASVSSHFYVTSSIALTGIDGISPLFECDPSVESSARIALQFVKSANVYNAENLVSYVNKFNAGDFIKVPEGALYVRFSCPNETTTPKVKTYGGIVPDNSVTTEKMADNSVTADKIASNAVTTVNVADDSITYEKQTVVNIETGKNLFAEEKMIVATNSWWWTVGGVLSVQSNQYTIGFVAIEIPIDDSQEYITVSNVSSTEKIQSWFMTESDGTTILSRCGDSAISERFDGDGYTIAIPSGAKKLKISISLYNYGGTNNYNMFNYGETKEEYEPYYENCYVMDYKVLTEENVRAITQTDDVLRLPKRYNLVVGDTFELFYKGILNVINPDEFDIEITFSDGVSRGKAWKRKYEFQPALTDIGTKSMSVTVRSNTGDVLETKAVQLVISNVPSSPVNTVNVLCIGDSLTTSGTWCSELRRRLIASNGTPTGYGLSRINFIGTKVNPDGCGYEGYGGWTFTSYLTANKSNEFMNIYGSFDKDSSDQHAIYKDANNIQWKLETISPSKIKIIRVSSSGTLPPTGTLTWVSGGVNTGNIVYSSSEQASGNPFWDEAENKNDFTAYAEKMGVSSIDHCIILLGWNSTNSTESDYKASATEFIDQLRAEFPDCKITLVGIQIPSRDGIANNYGVAWKFYSKMQFVWELNSWYEDIAEEYEDVEFVQLSGQFDTEYNCIATQMQVNVRNSQTISVQTNGIHPDTSGQYQIADAVLRNIVRRL